jgi:hypothetical protein
VARLACGLHRELLVPVPSLRLLRAVFPRMEFVPFAYVRPSV